MELQRDGSLEKGSVDLVLNGGSGPAGSVDASLIKEANSNNHNTITYNDPADTSE